MKQDNKLMRVKAEKMFKVSLSGALPIMVNPGDVVEVDRFMAGMLLNSGKAIETEEKCAIDPQYKPTAPKGQPDLLAAIRDGIAALTATLGPVALQKGR